MPDETQILLFAAFIMGGVIGVLIGWLLAARRQNSLPPDTRLENELRQQLAQRDNDLAQTRGQLSQSQTELATAKTAAQASQSTSEKMLAEQKALHEQTLRDAKAAQDKAIADLRDAFKAMSADALKQSAPEFLRLAEQSFGRFQETAKGDLDKRQESIKVLVEPLKQQLEAYQKNLQTSATAQASTLGEVKKQLELLSQQSHSLAQETQQFRLVLHSNQARGKWGEETLRRVVEAAGMSVHCDFIEQAATDENRPDLIVKLPGDRVIIVDAKVPELDFLSALETADPVERAKSLAAHAAKLRKTIRDLADRDYPRQFPNALDNVVLFVPAESLFSAALEGDRDLIVWAAEKRVLLATPASLIALLRSAVVSWRQYDQTRNAQAIAEAAQELFQRVLIFIEHFTKIRDGLEKATDFYNKALGSYETKLKPSGDRLLKLGGILTDKQLPEVPLLETSLRKLKDDQAD